MTILELQGLLATYSAQYGPGMQIHLDVFNEAMGTLERYDLQVETAIAAPVSLVLRPMGQPVLVQG